MEWTQENGLAKIEDSVVSTSLEAWGFYTKGSGFHID